MINYKNSSELSDYITKCYNKLADINSHLNDNPRPDTKRNLQAWVSYWEDELWLAIEAKSKLDEDDYKDKGLDYSNNN